MLNAVGVIPARLASTRLPRKLLLAETGKTLLQATWENACRSQLLSDVIIAADGRKYKLPNTTLTGNFQTRAAADASRQTAIANTNSALKTQINMEKWIIAEYTGATFNSDDVLAK